MWVLIEGSKPVVTSKNLLDVLSVIFHDIEDHEMVITETRSEYEDGKEVKRTIYAHKPMFGEVYVIYKVTVI